MKEFPYTLDVNNKDNFPEIYYKRILCYFRRDMYEHIIREDENNYFDLEKFQKQYKLTVENRDKMAKTIIEELEAFGWKCKLSFGDTGLFCYSDKQPKSCW
jgi:hypothetical protein